MTFWCFLSLIIVASISAAVAYDTGMTNGRDEMADVVYKLKEENRNLRKEVKKLKKEA